MKRPERTFERYGRGVALVRAIRSMWTQNVCGTSNTIINERIQGIVTEYDLTIAEWHYWCRQARSAAEVAS